MRELFIFILIFIAFAFTRKNVALKYHLHSGRSLGPKWDLLLFRFIRIVITAGALHMLLTEVWKVVSYQVSMIIIVSVAALGVIASLLELRNVKNP
jgi:hypothetical protein